MADNIIDFNQHRQKKRAGVLPDNTISLESLMEHLATLPDNGLMASVTEAVSDRMSRLLFLTELGQARAAEVEDERQEMFRGIFDQLSVEEKQTLAELLDKLLAAEGEVKEL